MSEWISVKGKLPKDGRWYLVAATIEVPGGGKRVASMAFLDFDTRTNEPIWLSHNDEDSGEWDNVTHWMPLPEPPNQ